MDCARRSVVGHGEEVAAEVTVVRLDDDHHRGGGNCRIGRRAAGVEDTQPFLRGERVVGGDGGGWPAERASQARRHAYLPCSISHFSTSSPWASGFTLDHTLPTRPSGAMTTVERIMPSYSLP